MCTIFTPPLPFGAVYFLKISKSFKFLTCFSFHCSFPTSSKAVQILWEHHPVAGKSSQPYTSPGDLLIGQASRIAAPSSGYGLLWHLHDFLLGSRDPPLITMAFLITCIHHTTCAAFHSQGIWAQLGTSFKTCQKMPFKVLLKDPFWAMTISHWAWGRPGGRISSVF